jgi:hypothetical protein
MGRIGSQYGSGKGEMVMKFSWERIDDYGASEGRTERAAVIGGWVIRTFTYDENAGMAMTFVPDLEHLWEIEND